MSFVQSDLCHVMSSRTAQPAQDTPTMQQVDTPNLIDITEPVLTWIQPVLDPQLRVKRTRRGLCRRHWRFGIEDYRQATQTCRSTRQQDFWKQIFRHMWLEIRRDLEISPRTTFNTEPRTYGDMHQVMKDQLSIDNKHAAIRKQKRCNRRKTLQSGKKRHHSRKTTTIREQKKRKILHA